MAPARLDHTDSVHYTDQHRPADPPEPAAPMNRHRDPSSTPSVQSPCVRNCCLDENDVCLGCGRQLQEILNWQQATDAERAAILVLARERRERR